jgi:hypothetical protein
MTKRKQTDDKTKGKERCAQRARKMKRSCRSGISGPEYIWEEKDRVRIIQKTDTRVVKKLRDDFEALKGPE